MTNDFKPAKAGGNQPRLSKEEYAEKKRAEKEKVYQMIDEDVYKRQALFSLFNFSFKVRDSLSCVFSSTISCSFCSSSSCTVSYTHLVVDVTCTHTTGI